MGAPFLRAATKSNNNPDTHCVRPWLRSDPTPTSTPTPTPTPDRERGSDCNADPDADPPTPATDLKVSDVIYIAGIGRSSSLPRAIRGLFQVCLDKFWARVDINGSKYVFAAVYESMRRLRRNDDDSARFGFARFISDREARGPLNDKANLYVRVRVQRRTFAGWRVDDVSRKRCALVFADEIVRHSDKRQLLEIEKTHRNNLHPLGIGDEGVCVRWLPKKRGIRVTQTQ
jgi:hypothetical protein